MPHLPKITCPSCGHLPVVHGDNGCRDRVCDCTATATDLRLALNNTLDQLGGPLTPDLIVHFGVYPHGTGELHVAGHGQTNVEYRFNQRFMVSGSWGCWGPADQDSDGDDSLHVLAELYPSEHPADVRGLATVLENLHRDVRSAVSSGRMHPWGTITTLDHSETTHVWTTEHHGGIRVFEVDGDGAAR